MKRLVSLVALALLAGSLRWAPQQSPTKERLRGVSAVDDRVAWASGNRTVLQTTDGGATWRVVFGPTAEPLDFRDVEAIDAETAYVLSIGSGDLSRIYKTTDGGKTWRCVFRNTDPKGFYDAIAFWNDRTGLALGDPVGGRFSMLRTTDGGETWTSTENMPAALASEGAFAASGTCLTVAGTNGAWFVTGGAEKARVFRSSDSGLHWDVADTPLMAGTSSAGGFSLAFEDERNGVLVGGDYRKEAASGDNVAMTRDGGVTWSLAPAQIRGFRSAVAFVPRRAGMVITVGPAGSDYSANGGRSWTAIGDEGFHAMSAARRGQAIWAVGEGGRIGKIVP